MKHTPGWVKPFGERFSDPLKYELDARSSIRGVLMWLATTLSSLSSPARAQVRVGAFVSLFSVRWVPCV